MKVALFTNCRDEHNIIEWALYHALLGFDQIVIYDHLSIVPITSYLSNRVPNVVVIRENQRDRVKMKLCREAYSYALKRKFTHLIYLDSDEYLVLKQHATVQKLISSLGNPAGIAFNWVPYGNNSQIFRSTSLLIEESCYRPIHDPKNRFFDHVKTLQRLDAINGTLTNPHYYNYREGNHNSVNVIGKRLAQLSLSPFSPELLETAYIAHFHTQSLEDYQRRQVLRGADSTSRLKKTQFTVYPMNFVIYDDHLKKRYGLVLRHLIDHYGLSLAQSKLKSEWVPRLIDLNRLDEYLTLSTYQQVGILEDLVRCDSRLGDHREKLGTGQSLGGVES
jgi:hypothetical protein